MIKNSWRGFSLIELTVVLFISSILLITALTNWHYFLKKQIHQMQVTTIFHSLQFARSEAIHRHQIVNICGTADFRHCQADWSEGFMVFINKQSSLAILRQESFGQRISISSGKLKTIRFGSDGRCLTRGTITVKDVNRSSKIIMFDSGRVRIESEH